MRWFTIARTVHRYWRMAHDPRTPKAVRYLIYGGIAYTLVPDDWKPEWLPGLGLVDDAAVIPMTVGIAMAMIPKDVKEDAKKERAEAEAPARVRQGAPILVPVAPHPESA